MQCLKHIVSYCEQIDLAVEQFGASYSIFAVDSVYRNHCRIVAHCYGTVDHTIIGNVVEYDIPPLKAYCVRRNLSE